MANTDKHLFHLMAEKMEELTVVGDLVPDDDDLSLLLTVLSCVIVHRDRCTKYEDAASSALAFAAGELSGDMGYEINERRGCIDELLNSLVDCGDLEEMCGSNHIAYLRR